MQQLAMPGWETAKNMEPEEIFGIIDGMALRDYQDDTPLAIRWGGRKAGACLDCDCRDPDSEVRPGTYLLSHSPSLLYEGLRIVGRALGIAQIQITVSSEQENLARRQFQSWPELEIRCSEAAECAARVPGIVISHSAETFLHVARLFRREGAGRRLCYVSGCGVAPRYLEVPLTSTFWEIADMTGAKKPVRAWVKTGEKQAYMEMNAMPMPGPCPNIRFE